jgi:Holliday junction resolvase RusA-like endonuclease
MLIRIPLPPTDNELHLVSRTSGRLVDSPKYRAWKREVTKILFVADLKRNPEPSYVSQHTYNVEIVMTNYKSDFTNYIKAAKDIMQGFLYQDDQWVNFRIIMPVTVDPTTTTGFLIIETTPEIHAIV